MFHQSSNRVLGGYAFITNMIPLHSLILLFMGRFTNRLYVAYSSWYAVGTLASMQVPFVGFQPVRTSEHMAALGMSPLLEKCENANTAATRCVWTSSTRRFYGPGSFARELETIPNFVARVCGPIRRSGRIGLWRIDYEGLDCPLDWSVLLTLGHRICEEVRHDFLSFEQTAYHFHYRYIPIIASVSEHQPTAWPSFFMDLHFLIVLFPAGVFFCFSELRDEQVFVIIYAVVASYFAGVMVRLMLTLTPVVCVTAAIALSNLLERYMDPAQPDPRKDDGASEGKSSENGADGAHAAVASDGGKVKKSKKAASANDTNIEETFTWIADRLTANARKDGKRGVFGIDTRILVIGNALFMMISFVMHCTWVTASAYSSPSVVLSSVNQDGSKHIIDDFREAYYWLRENTREDAVVMSWWDYGYQIAGMADRPTLVDNNTWNNSA